MTISKCAICRNRKGKRFCPEQKAMICAPCCGKRIYNQAECPQDCMYWISSQNYRKQKGDNMTAQVETGEKLDWVVIAVMERSIYDRLQKDVYYEDRDILQGIERKINALENPEMAQEVLLNRSGVIESALDEVIKTLGHEDSNKFSHDRILHALRSYARIVRQLGTSRKGGHRYIDKIKERVAEIEKKLEKERSEGKDISGYPLISLPFGQ